MSRLIFALSVLACAAICAWGDVPQLKQLNPPTGWKVAGLEISAPQTTIPGQRVAVIVAVTDGEFVKWEVKGGTWSSEIEGKNLLVGLSGQPEIITVRAVTALTVSTMTGTKVVPTDTATTTVTVPSAGKSTAPPLKNGTVPKLLKTKQPELKDIEDK